MIVLNGPMPTPRELSCIYRRFFTSWKPVPVWGTQVVIPFCVGRCHGGHQQIVLTKAEFDKLRLEYRLYGS